MERGGGLFVFCFLFLSSWYNIQFCFNNFNRSLFRLFAKKLIIVYSKAVSLLRQYEIKLAARLIVH